MCPLLFSTMAKTGNAGSYVHGIYVGKCAHTGGLSARPVHPWAMPPMSQASVIYRLATVCDAQCLRQVCRRNHPGICRPLRDPMAGWGSHTPPHSTPSCPRSRPLESTALQHGDRTVRSIAPLHTSSWSNLPPQRAPSPAPVQGLRPKSQAMPRVGGRAKKIKPVWILSQNGIRHVST